MIIRYFVFVIVIEWCVHWIIAYQCYWH